MADDVKDTTEGQWATRIEQLRTLAFRLERPHSNFLATEAARHMRIIADELRALSAPSVVTPQETKDDHARVDKAHAAGMASAREDAR